MTTSTTKPRRAKRRKTTPKPMTEQTFTVKEETKVLPVVLPKPTDDIIPLSSYVQDAKNRWKIHQYEIKELSKDTQWVYNKAKPFVEKVIARFSPKAS